MLLVMTWDWFVRIILREHLEVGVVTDYWCCCILEEVTEKLVGWSNLFARLLENMIINQPASPYTGNPDIAADKSWTRRGIFRVKWMASSELERRLMMMVKTAGEKKTPISRNWTLLAKEVEQQSWKGFYQRLLLPSLFTWSRTLVLCCFLYTGHTCSISSSNHH